MMISCNLGQRNCHMICDTYPKIRLVSWYQDLEGVAYHAFESMKLSVVEVKNVK